MASAVIWAMLAAGAIIVGEAPRPAPVSVQGAGVGQYLAGPGGHTLYVFDGDEAVRPCQDACLQAWPPLLAAPDDKAVGDWKPVRRDAETLQWTYKSRPVYTFRSDSKPGEASGDGVGGAWHALQYGGKPPAVAVPPAAAVARLGDGFALTDYRGRTLYTFKRDGKRPACKAECLDVWPPLLAPAAAVPKGAWTPVERPDGVRQWAYRGRLVYTYSDDLAGGEAHGADAGGVWKTLPVTDRDANVSRRDERLAQQTAR